MVDVLLLRASKPGKDPYDWALSECVAHRVKCVPVLEISFECHQSRVKEAMSSPDRFSGLILTSGNAVQAIEACGLPPFLWADRQIFVVGKKTAEHVEQCACLRGTTVHGQGTGSATALAELIAKDRKIVDGVEREKPILFLCGDSRRDELPMRLKADQVVNFRISVLALLTDFCVILSFVTSNS